MIEKINWYPGHMKKTRELIEENLRAVDAVVELVDARIPLSSRNPIIGEITRGRPRIIALNKSDLSDPEETKAWVKRLTEEGRAKGEDVLRVLGINSMSGEGTKQLLQVLKELEGKKDEARGRHKPLRMMIVGVPNVGKSSLINRLTGRKSAQTGDRPGVTKGKQWLTLKNGMQLLDTPGILWPKFEDPKVGLNLAFCGSIKDEILDSGDLALELIKILMEEYPEMLKERYKLKEIPEEALETMEAIAAARGFILPGKRIDYERCARTVLDEFRSARIGKISLERA